MSSIFPPAVDSAADATKTGRRFAEIACLRAIQCASASGTRDCPAVAPHFPEVQADLEAQGYTVKHDGEKYDISF